jgi:predicted MPP superfamily phosphohydrolase
MLTRNKIIIGLLCIASSLAIWAFIIEPAGFRINEERISVYKWPVQCNGKRIAILADLHVGSPHKGLNSLRDLVKRVNAAKPDLVLLPGDFVIQGVVGGSFVSPEDAGEVLGKLKAPMGVFAVLGNHDWWLSAKRVGKALSDNEITMLPDTSQRIAMDDCRLSLVGITDFWEGPHNVEQAMASVSSDEPILAFTHNPDIFPELPESISLTIAGHTHGGQVCFPFFGCPIVPSQFGELYNRGHVIEGEKHLYVSSGVGTSILPVRFLVPPEVTILEVHKEVSVALRK